jgi:two-component system phosphate regulon sensor histidine kinase PhoR
VIRREPAARGRHVGLRFVLVAVVAVVAGAATLAGGWVARFGPGWGGVIGMALVVAGLGGVAGAVLSVPIEAGLARIREGLTGRGASDVGSHVAEVHGVARAVRARLGEEDERRRALEGERADLAALLAAVDEGILLVDRDARIVRANPAAAALLGLPEGFEGSAAGSAIRSTAVRRIIETAVRDGEPEAVEEELDGRRVFAVAQPAGRQGTVLSLVDLTEIRRLETARRDFVANASHELKTPLTSIRGYAETLVDDALPDDLRRGFVEIIRQNADRLQRVVDDLLDLSRIEAGAWDPDLKPMRLDDAAREVWAALGGAAADKGVELEVGGGAEVEVLADAFGVRQILTNLLDNAIRHSADGGTVRVDAERVGTEADDAPGAVAYYEVAVSDRGAGIGSDALPRIFERFFRVDAARTGAAGGTGLGLAIVKHLVEQTGGAVRAESELGRGTTVFFTIPSSARDAPVPGDEARFSPRSPRGGLPRREVSSILRGAGPRS